MKNGKQTVEATIQAGIRKASLKPGRMMTAGILAGAFIAFGAFGSQTASLYTGKVVSSLVFPIGLTMVILTGSELFTGNSLMSISVMDRKNATAAVLKNWAFVYIGNLIGSLLIAAAAGCLAGGDLAESMRNTAVSKASLPIMQMILKGVLCNILVCMAVYCQTACEEPAGKIPALYLPTFLFVLSGFEHSIANMYFIPAGMIAGASGIFTGLLTNLLFVTIGNIIGGVLISALLYYANR